MKPPPPHPPAALRYLIVCDVQAGLYTCVLPSLFFTYLGQAAYLIQFPKAVESIYYNSLPRPVYWPMFVIATLAAIVASQVRHCLLLFLTCMPSFGPSYLLAW